MGSQTGDSPQQRKAHKKETSYDGGKIPAFRVNKKPVRISTVYKKPVFTQSLQSCIEHKEAKKRKMMPRNVFDLFCTEVYNYNTYQKIL